MISPFARPPLLAVLNDVARAFGLDAQQLAGRSRSTHVVAARQAAMLLLREHYRLSLPAIGSLLGGRDHSTVLHGVAAAVIRCRHDAGYAACVAALTPKEPAMTTEELFTVLKDLGRNAGLVLGNYEEAELEQLLTLSWDVAEAAQAELRRRAQTAPPAPTNA